ncbi:hypothetical protein H310_12248 [Aphanomyces invadans]|uniref:Hexose transporter 1 n=1 Tax=Aphanomyces invadans TaxID=157072 RepID=A0A024TIX3_9STRA|nr:hypothetical protein H310_12248 [Aphanomyces invadans]ETV93904.1 hypothetical protein H310_12248 [Aphanomyces invadans]|eukprot:XP_008877464.1 hypothetical protein H310_12248 [Aphanomyces invadans]
MQREATGTNEFTRISTRANASPQTVPDVLMFDTESYQAVKDTSTITPLVASPAMRRSILCALLGAFQFGWMMAEMAYIPFHHPKLCLLPRIPQGQCLVFPGHSTAEWTMQSTAWAVGGGLGALLSAVPADYLGRQRTLGYNGCLMVAGGLVQLFATDIYTFAVGRGLNGIASGVAINVLNNYLRELSPVQWRMFYLTLVQIALSVGTLVVTTFMYAIPDVPSTAWQFKPLFGGPVVIGVLQVASMPWIVESPVWLLHRDQLDEARHVMHQLYMPAGIEAHWTALVSTIDRQTREAASSSSKLSLLVSPKYRKQFSIAIVLATMQQLCGMNALVVYGPAMFKAIGIRELRLSNSIVNFGRFHDMYLAGKFGDRFNRRTLLLAGSMGMILGSLGFTLCQVYPSDTNDWIQIACTLMFVASFCASIGSMGWLVSTEVVPEVLGATSGAISTCCTWTAQFFIGVYFQQISSPEHWGTQAFGMFPAVLVVFAVFVWMFVPETRHRTTDEVTALFSAIADTESSRPEKDNEVA